MPKRNRNTGRPKGAQPGSRNALVNGMRTAAMNEHRKMFWRLMSAAGEAIRQAKTGSKVSIRGNSPG